MNLLTKSIEKEFEKHPLYSQDGKGYESKVLVKYFNPQGAGTWIITEAEKMTAEKDGNDDWLLYGLCEIGYDWEWGPILLSELQKFVGRMGLGIERDLYIPNGCKVKDLVKEKAV